MIDKKVMRSEIYGELSAKEKEFWFDLKQQKYLPNIDTLYYTIKLDIDEKNENQQIFWKFVKRNAEMAGYNEFCTSSLNNKFIVRNVSYGGIYRTCHGLADCYDVFIAEKVPNPDTPQICVQIRSQFLWRLGPENAVKESYSEIALILGEFGFEKLTQGITRTDFCWHTNYVQNPNSFLDLYHFGKMRIGRLSEYCVHGHFIDDLPTTEYIGVGSKKSNNVFFRVYDKTTEVVEKGYKAFFFYIWLFQGLISRYDLYCLEGAYKERSMDALDRTRLQFYIDYGKDEAVKKEFEIALEKNNLPYIRKIANIYTPKVTTILNFEYQCNRKFFKSMKIGAVKQLSGELAEILTVVKYRSVICDYLTHDTFRLVTPTGDVNRSRRDYAPVWDKLRKAKYDDCPTPPLRAHVIREKAKALNTDALKQRAISAVTSFACASGQVKSSIHTDSLDLLCSMNDNDQRWYERYKLKKLQLLGLDSTTGATATPLPLSIIDNESGSYIA